MPFTIRTVTVIGIVILGLLTPAWANEVAATYKRLTQSRSLKCVFVEGAQADWSNGRLNISTTKNEEFALHFDSIDAKKGTARLIGNAGAADVATILTAQGLTFIEQTPSGNLNFTTVFPFYKKGTQDFVAVTSRHLLFPGIDGKKPFPSQGHGTCQVWE
jgi:hypothetical protein